VAEASLEGADRFFDGKESFEGGPRYVTDSLMPRTGLPSMATGHPVGVMSRPTMREVAALAGVSVKTVSRVINTEPAVSARSRSRVQSAVEQLRYRHSLRRTDGKSATIGLLLGDVANPFSSHLHREIENAALERGVLVFVGSSDEDENRERQLISAFTAHRVDGMVIVATIQDHGFLASERRAGTAIVFVDCPPCFLDSDSVVT
jgi:LacI family transcriptional regulator